MIRTAGRSAAAIVACAAVALSGCSKHSDPGPLSAIVSPAIPPSVQEISNPLRGQYEDLLNPLFPQGNPAQQRYPAWPASYDASMRISWRQLQPIDPATLPPDAPDDRRYDFSAIDDTLNKLASRNMRLGLRIVTVTPDPHDPIAIPDWMRPASTSSPAAPNSPGVTQVVPNWDDPRYLDAFGRLLSALGRRYDGDERLSVFEFSGYNQSGQFRDQSISAASIRQLVTANVDAFPHTQLVVAPQNPEIVRALLADEVTKKLSAPVGIRAECLGAQSPLPAWAESGDSQYVRNNDAVVNALKQRLASAPVITEWCPPPPGTDPKAYYEKALHDVVRYHVSMTASANFPDRDATAAMDPKLYALWAQANAAAGYRYSVQARPGSQSIQGTVASISVEWTNYGSAASTEQWVPGYKLVDSSGAVVRTLPATVNLKTLVHDDSSPSREEAVPATFSETVHVDLAGVAPGHYTLRAAVDWQQHKPGASHVVNYGPMALARDGRDGSGAYPIATLDIPRSGIAGTGG
ncbi:hypothetical protein [Mycobacterium sherrisii]|uniref:DUF4832 domain-containing protein n=1 Tax=Mycobacterium sherrisii TaxID=243061 RepID=A0A1E3SX63_9MYCO|nr:hypothetical protein [Mycobacterium sherrisii]MCV7031545.1 hypothetical protein [Mycobacterium sherrisii]ODR06233.1 hypothetical protein BHQ21_12000 [Mycobacterium sherrisii]ORW86017.1 hypothetical protein AWC25_21015 [Mycobacterium sherrisii]